MEEQLQKAFEIANYMTTLAGQKRVLLEEFQQNTVYFHNGSTFKATKELINFVNTLIQLDQKDAVLIDDNNIPVDIQDLPKFLEQIMHTYTYASNTYFTKYQQLKTARSVESLLDL